MKNQVTIKHEIGKVTATGLEPRTTQFLNEHSIIWPNHLKKGQSPCKILDFEIKEISELLNVKYQKHTLTG